MSVRNTSTQSGIFPTVQQARTGEPKSSVWRLALNPASLGLFVLAFAVAFLGYNCKVSQFCPPSTHSANQIQSAKLWIEHRFGFSELTVGATAPTTRGRVYAEQGAFAFSAAAPALVFRGAPRGIPLRARPRAVPFFHSAIPLRSPPFPISL